MSRFEIWHDNYAIGFGQDHACGLFLQVWKVPSDIKQKAIMKEFGIEEEDLVVDMDSMFHSEFNENEFMNLIHVYGFTYDEVKEKIEKCRK